MTEETHNPITWPTTVGAVCIVVGGLSLFGGCLVLTGMSEMEQLHTAIPFGGGEIDEELLAQLADLAPTPWLTTMMSSLTILFSIVLTMLGIGLLQREPRTAAMLRYWAWSYMLCTIAQTLVLWIPRWDLVETNHEVKGLFLAQIVISSPMYLVLPIFLLVYLSRCQVRDEVARWR